MTTHALTRTSPIGERFIGTCTKCGMKGLTLAQSQDECANVRGVSETQALLEAIDPEFGKESEN